MDTDTGYQAVHGLIKFFLFLFILFIFALPLFFFVYQSPVSQKSDQPAVFPLVTNHIAGIGKVEEPLIPVAVKLPTGYQTYYFLVDSGATFSSLPYEMAADLGFNPVYLKRLAFRGFGNTTTFAYQAEMDIKLQSKELRVPVVFTEAGGSRLLLGRKGFFEHFDIYFNHRHSQLEIK